MDAGNMTQLPMMDNQRCIVGPAKYLTDLNIPREGTYSFVLFYRASQNALIAPLLTSKTGYNDPTG